MSLILNGTTSFLLIGSSLACCFQCSPPLFVYNSLDLFGQLNSVVRVACLEAIRVYEVRREIHVSTLFQWYRKDFGKNDLEAIR